VIVAFVLTRLDYDNATLAGLPANLLDRLQSVLSASAQLIAGSCHSAHITDALASFHCYMPLSELSSDWWLSSAGNSTALRLVTCPAC